MPLRTALLVSLAVIAAATLTVLAFPPVGAFWLAPFALVPLVLVIDGGTPRTAFAAGFLYLMATGLLVCRWLTAALVQNWEVPVTAAWAVSAGLVALCAWAPGTCVALYAFLRPSVGKAGAPLLFGAVWVLGEWLRSGPLGVPWLLIGHPLAPWPLAIQIADLGGALAVSFVCASVAAGLALGLRERRLAPAAVPALLAAATLVYGAVRLPGSHDPAARGERSLRVGVLQGGLTANERFQSDSPWRHLTLLSERTRALAAAAPLDLAVWFETAVDGNLDETPGTTEALARLSDELGIAIAAGAQRGPSDALVNALVLFAPGRGVAGSYAKQILVPFAESTPPLSEQVALYTGSLLARTPYVVGSEATVFRNLAVSFSGTICFEITYPALVRRLRLAGGEVLLNVSNDAWFDAPGYAWLHLHHGVFRAVELRTWVVRAANGGISAAIDAHGRVLTWLPPAQDGQLVAEVPAAPALPVYARWGDTPLLALCLMIAAAAIGARASAGRGRRGGS